MAIPVGCGHLLLTAAWGGQVANAVIKPVSAPDYTATEQVVEPLQITPHCDANTDLRTALETVVANELLARQTGNWPALASLMHS